MKSYDSLVRLGRWRLEEARRAHAEIARHRDDLAAERALLLGRLADERAGGDAEVATRLDVHLYFRWATAKSAELDAVIAEAEDRLRISREAMAEVYGELKTLELARDRARERAEAERARRERAELDEISLDLYRRGAGGAI